MSAFKFAYCAWSTLSSPVHKINLTLDEFMMMEEQILKDCCLLKSITGNGSQWDLWSNRSAYGAFGLCRQSTVATVNSVFFFFLSSASLTFLQEGVLYYFVWGINKKGRYKMKEPKKPPPLFPTVPPHLNNYKVAYNIHIFNPMIIICVVINALLF